VAEGLRFIRRSRVLTGALLADLNATVLGMPVALFPAINADRFGGSPRTLGLLSAALAVGGVVGSILSGPVGHLRRQGCAMLVAGGLWGAGLAGFGLARSLWLTLLMLALAGVADVLSVIFRTSIVLASRFRLVRIKSSLS
jgi:MFS family permease